MLVTINPAYKGTYGYYRPELGTVTAKRAGCEPFDEDPEIARKQIKNGVMVAVDTATEADVKKSDAGTPNKDPKTMTYPELKAAAKDRGISVKGVKKEQIADLIEAYDSQVDDAPEISAFDPE